MYSENDYRYYSENSLTHYGIKGMRWGKHKAKRVARINKAFREAKAADDRYENVKNLNADDRKYFGEMLSRGATGRGYVSPNNNKYVKGPSKTKEWYDEYVRNQLEEARAKQQKDLADKQLLYSQQPFRKTMDQLSSKIKDVKKKLKDFFKIETKRNITGYVFSREEGRQVGELLKKK